MSYAIIRNTKYKRENLKGIYRHNERRNKNYSNRNVNPELSHLNYSLKDCKHSYEKEFDLIKNKYNLKGQIKTVSNIACEYIITSDKEYFNSIGIDETKRYFETAYKFVCEYKNLGEQYILSAKVHMDESTPHLHLVFVPVVQKLDKKTGNKINKIACSEFWKGKNSYQQLQDNFYQYITDNGFTLERGKTRNIEHLSTEKLKQITNYDNIKYELTQKEIKPINTKNTSLIIQQNNELIKYTNKLKVQLSKSYTTINKLEELQQENTNLKYENEKLKKENYRLKNYIEKTFEVVKNLFSFPIDRFKRLVNNLVKYFEK